MKKLRRQNARPSGANTATIAGLHRQFLRYKRAEGVSDRTLADYRDTFGYFMTYLNDEDIHRDELTAELLLEYKTFMLERYKPNTVNVRIRTMHTFLRYCYEQGLVAEPLHEHMKKVRAPIDNVEALEPAEVERLLAVANERADEWHSAFRNKVIVLTLLDTMARISEITAAKRHNLDLGAGVLYLEGANVKTRQGREVPLSARTCDLLREYVDETADFGSELLFVTYMGQPLAANTIRKFLTEYAEAAGIKRQVSPHVLRHTGALLYVMNGGDPFSLQKILGHRDMSMTRRYVQMASANVKNRHDQFSPLSKLEFE